jgi:sorbitol/mannitol transport system substrate-binding protein
MPDQPKYDEIAKFADALTDKTEGVYGITLRGRPRLG